MNIFSPDSSAYLLWSMQTITTLDLSCNRFIAVPDELLLLERLAVLYLHGNIIAKLKTVDKLRKIPMLRAVTLHGNEVEEVDGYRPYVISLCKGLRALDFTTITPKERRDADLWRRMFGGKK